MFRWRAILWLPVLALKLALVLAGLLIVPLGLAIGRLPRIYRGEPATWHNLAIRNPVSGFGWLFVQPPAFNQKTNWLFRGPMESAPLAASNQRSAYRWRWTDWRISYRYLRLLKRNRYLEVYFGWKLGSTPTELDFATQIRIGRVGN